MGSESTIVSSVLWDLDDTLLATTETATAARAAAVAAMCASGLPAKSLAEATAKFELLVKRFGSTDYYNLCWALVAEYRVRAALRDKLIDVGGKAYKERFSAIKPFPDSKRTLATLKREDYKLGIISTGEKDFQLYKLRKTGLLNYFYQGNYFDEDFVFVSSDFGKAAEKPSPLMYQKAIHKLGLRPPKIMFVGDRPSDVVGANLVGMRSVLMVGDKGSNKDYTPKLRLEKPDHRVGKVSEILKILLI